MTEDTVGNETVFRFPMILSQTDNNDKTKLIRGIIASQKEIGVNIKYFAFCICLSLVTVPSHEGTPSTESSLIFHPPSWPQMASIGLGYWI